MDGGMTVILMVPAADVIWQPAKPLEIIDPSSRPIAEKLALFYHNLIQRHSIILG
jgi:hypothetical protein